MNKISFRRGLIAVALTVLAGGVYAVARAPDSETPLQATAATSATLMIAKKRIMVPSGGGAWDWMAVDNGKRRLLATHKGQGAVEILDSKPCARSRSPALWTPSRSTRSAG